MPAECSIMETTSDDFFERHSVAELAGDPADMSFIDGLHVFDYALRDFRNAERNSHRKGVILFHDCYPPPELAVPERSGDVWKVLIALRDYRPDLTLSTLLSPPSGIGVVSHLDPTNTVLWDKYDEVMERYADLSYDEACTRELPVNPVGTRPWRAVRSVLPSEPYRPRSTTDLARTSLRRGSNAARMFSKRTAARVKRKLANRGR
jgi:hypothetical protein